MAKEELLEFDGTVTEVLPDGNFRVKLDNEHEVLAYTAGKMRKFRIRTGVGDRVIVEMSPYDLQRGRISFRHKGDAPAPGPQTRRPNFRRDNDRCPGPQGRDIFDVWGHGTTAGSARRAMNFSSRVCRRFLPAPFRRRARRQSRRRRTAR